MHKDCSRQFLELPYRLQYSAAFRAFLTEEGDLELTDRDFPTVIFERARERGMLDKFCAAIAEVHAAEKLRARRAARRR